MNLILRFQHLVQQNLYYCWIIDRDPTSEQCLFFSTITTKRVEELREKFATVCTIEDKPPFDGEFANEPKPETRMQVQKELFDAGND